MKKCAICGNEFPNHIVIQGKERNVQRRKYCLECSPFGQHNTSKEPIQESGKAREGKQIKRRKAYNVQWTNQKRRQLKNKLIKYKGGQCSRCGYNKPIPDAYAFHHRDPSEKNFTISSIIQRAWDFVLQETDKCDLLCVLCHA